MRALCSWVCTIAILSLLGCSSQRHAVPEAGEFAIPPLKYDLIRDKRISVQIRDQRQQSEFSPELVNALERAVTDSLKRAEVAVDQGAGDVIEVRVARYGAELRLGEWKGCAALSAVVRVGGKPEESSSEQCVVEKDTDGVHSGDQAMRRALQDALALLLHKVDRMGR